MSISKVRGWLYKIAKYAGDIQALRSPKKNAIQNRIGRRIVGRFAGKTIGRLFR